MKRYASHYVLSPDMEWIRLPVVEIDGEEIKLYPVSEELHSIEWLPGVILLLSKNRNRIGEEPYQQDIFISAKHSPLQEMFLSVHSEEFEIFYLSPFDFTLMQPVSETRSRQLL